jgi:hypothetical protein
VDVCATFSADGLMGKRETMITLSRGRETERENLSQVSQGTRTIFVVNKVSFFVFRLCFSCFDLLVVSVLYLVS